MAETSEWPMSLYDFPDDPRTKALHRVAVLLAAGAVVVVVVVAAAVAVVALLERAAAPSGAISDAALVEMLRDGLQLAPDDSVVLSAKTKSALIRSDTNRDETGWHAEIADVAKRIPPGRLQEIEIVTGVSRYYFCLDSSGTSVAATGSLGPTTSEATSASSSLTRSTQASITTIRIVVCGPATLEQLTTLVDDLRTMAGSSRVVFYVCPARGSGTCDQSLVPAVVRAGYDVQAALWKRPDDLTYWPRPILYDAVIRAVNFIEPCGPSPTECLLPPREFPPSGQSSLVGIGLKRWNGTGTCLRDDDGLSAFIALDVTAREPGRIGYTVSAGHTTNRPGGDTRQDQTRYCYVGDNSCYEFQCTLSRLREREPFTIRCNPGHAYSGF
ncbi:unnamed protein product (mitochondrion) [Plasmodiophora brassicae]|uniref:Uncharacterized protein n=1 Tax=Plasmodiophora brassicae TaxID=37360 RepID=A0A3P3YJU0_PLABS|nr:unnamed protein product [Plasmodiophora brassicae]